MTERRSQTQPSLGLFSIKAMRFNELIRLLEGNGFRLVKEKGSICYYGYGKPDHHR